jgi:hypothetical protein
MIYTKLPHSILCPREILNSTNVFGEVGKKLKGPVGLDRPARLSWEGEAFVFAVGNGRLGTIIVSTIT